MTLQGNASVCQGLSLDVPLTLLGAYINRQRTTCLLCQLLSKVTVTSCRFCIKCSMYPPCCWTTHSSRRRHWAMVRSVASPAWVRRPAARWTHWTFDIKTAGCDSYIRQQLRQQTRCFLLLISLKCVVTEVVLFSIVARKTLEISQGSVATHLRCGGIFSDSTITNFLLILIVK